MRSFNHEVRPENDAMRPHARRIRPTRAEIDLAALRSNLAAVRSLAPKANVLAVVKANAYGHGAVAVARALDALDDVTLFGVALIEEGIELREAGIRKPILVLGGAYEGGYDALVAWDLMPTVFRREHLTQLGEAAARAGRTARAHVKVDTGMGRIGVARQDWEAFLDHAIRIPNVVFDGLMSHFANADVPDSALTGEQVARFKWALNEMRKRGMEPRYRHLSNSAGTLDRPETRDGLDLNLVRPGIMLYGLCPADWMKDRIPLQPILSWKTAITHLKSVPAGTPISYGGIWTAPRDSVIATLPVGYADGYSRQFSNRADVLINGQRAKVVGRVCMDMFMVDVTDIPGVEVGDEAVLIGAQGDQRIDAGELAAIAQTIHYEVLCDISYRVPREAK